MPPPVRQTGAMRTRRADLAEPAGLEGPEGTPPDATGPARPSLFRRLWTRIKRIPRFPLILAVFGYLAADTPSLLPRPWYFQGLISGILALIFYAVGLAIASAVRAIGRWSDFRMSINSRAKRVAGIILIVLLAIGTLIYPVVNLVWHYAVTAYVGEPPPGPLYPIGSTLTAAVVMALFIGLFKAIAALVRWVTAHVGRHVAKVKTARLIATVLTVVVVGGVLDQVVARGLLAAAKAQADAANASVPGGLKAPTSTLRSGGPGSLVTWESIGADGKTFIGSGPTAEEITAAVNEPAKEPIRVFVAVDNNRTLEQTRDLAIAELDRTGGFDRKAVLVVTSTSTGFVNEWAAESFEYLLRGDTAIVTMQYSTLPSALALITTRQQPPLVGRMLFDGVAARVNARPEGTRPKLYAGGESLGAYGGNGAFDSPADMLSKLDGALWTGTPSFTDLHAELTENRTYGSTTIDPTIDDGRHIRFAGDVPRLSADEYGHAYSPWEAPRVAYLQHDNDPVVWWSPSLLLSTPSWLEETRIPDTPMSYMSWLPFVTFWQVSGDMAMSNSVPGGFGHRYYETETVPAWAGILGMPINGDYTRIMAAIHAANPG